MNEAATPEPTHAPAAAATQLASKVASQSRHVCLLFGAGTSCAAGLPDVKALLVAVLDSLEGETLAAAQRLYTGRNLEEGLTRLRRIRALLGGSETFDGLTADTAAQLEQAITSAVIAQLSAGGLDLTHAKQLATWASGDFYRRPVELFTVNYDLLFERGLEEIGASYFDGFVGSLAAGFRDDLVDTGRQPSGEHRPTSASTACSNRRTVEPTCLDARLLRARQPSTPSHWRRRLPSPTSTSLRPSTPRSPGEAASCPLRRARRTSAPARVDFATPMTHATPAASPPNQQTQRCPAPHHEELGAFGIPTPIESWAFRHLQKPALINATESAATTRCDQPSTTTPQAHRSLPRTLAGSHTSL